MNSSWFPTDNPYIQCRIEATILSQSIRNNTSSVQVRVFVRRTNNYSPGTQGAGTVYCTINGTQYTEYHNHEDERVFITQTGLYMFTRTVTVPHDAAGTKTLSCSARISYTRFTATSHSASFVLTTIPRATIPEFSASSVYMGEDITITLNRAADTYTHDLAWSYNGGAFTQIATGVQTSYTWRVPDLVSSVTDADRTSIMIRATTHNGTEVMGDQTAEFFAVVPANVIPTINNPTMTELTEGIAEQFGAFIQSHSSIEFTLSASGARGSTIEAYSATFNNATYVTQTFQTPVIDVGGAIPLHIVVADSRGRVATRDIDVTIIPFSPPQLFRFSVERCDQLHRPDDSGDYIAIDLAYNVPALNGGATAAVSIGYRRTIEGGQYTEFYTSSALTQDGTVYPAQQFSSDYQLDFQIEIKDFFENTVSATGYVPGGDVVFDIAADGEGFAFFKTAERGGLEVKNGKPFYVHGLEIIPLIQSLFPAFPDILGRFRAGRVSITPTADTPTKVTVAFDVPMAHTPLVICTPESSVPGTIVLGVGTANRSVNGFDVYLTRVNSTVTSVDWIAIDLQQDEPTMIEIPDITQDEQTGVLSISGTREIEEGSETEPVVEQDEQTGVVSIT